MEVAYACDVGSIAQGNFAWCSGANCSNPPTHTGDNPETLATHIVDDLDQDHRVALGFECPLYVPVPESYRQLACGRDVDGNRPFSAGAGAASLVTGLVQLCWVLQTIRCRAASAVRPTLRLQEFTTGEANLFLWEAFVSGAAKTADHAGDARAACEAYLDYRRDRHAAVPVSRDRCLSLAGAALLWAGLSSDPTVLDGPCCVLKAIA